MDISLWNFLMLRRGNIIYVIVYIYIFNSIVTHVLSGNILAFGELVKLDMNSLIKSCKFGEF